MVRTMSTPILFLGNKNYSSWSLRPWLALRWGGIEFRERMIWLGGHGYGKSQIPEVLAISPSGRVPALAVQDATIYDSLAICEWAAEQAPSLYPKDALVRAQCRSAICEMHSSFSALRRDMAMNIRRRTHARAWPEDTRADIVRVFELWTDLRTRFLGDGPFLFGPRSLADAFFAPVVTRFRTYGVALTPVLEAYSAAVLSDPDFRAWEAAAQAEAAVIDETEAL
jgi:glutathione S-transferase